jgi:signal transduction histidine kinase
LTLSIISPGIRNQADWQRTNLAAFCQELRQAHAERLQRQHVTVHCQVARELTCEFPRHQVRRILDAWIAEALDEMPEGGELDISVVCGAAGLEIEVADSRDTDIHETRDYWHRQLQIAPGTSADARHFADLRLETSLCPQGGLARTVIVPPPATAPSAASAPWWRKAA